MNIKKFDIRTREEVPYHIEIDGVQDAMHNRCLDTQARDYWNLVGMYTAPGKRTTAEVASMQRNADRLLDSDNLCITWYAIQEWDRRFDMSGALWPAYVDVLG